MVENLPIGYTKIMGRNNVRTGTNHNLFNSGEHRNDWIHENKKILIE